MNSQWIVPTSQTIFLPVVSIIFHYDYFSVSWEHFTLVEHCKMKKYLNLQNSFKIFDFFLERST